MQLRDALARGRRLLAFFVPLLVFALLVLVGWRVSAPSTADVAWASSPDAPAPAANDSLDADSALAPATSVDAAASIDAPRPALDLLADGAVIVDLNTADEDELCRLPGIGPTRARAILALRAKLGRFKSVDDLARIKGIGRTLLRRLRPWTRIGP
jgi:competence protein ComEA